MAFVIFVLSAYIYLLENYYIYYSKTASERHGVLKG